MRNGRPRLNDPVETARTMMTELAVYGGLLLTALAAATILPMQSEAALVGLVLTDAYPLWALLAAASIGNVLGSVINWLLGRGIDRFHDRRWFPITPAALDRASSWYRGYGKWSLLLSWAPIIGDPLTVVAGVLREPFLIFLVLVIIAKVGRYILLVSATLMVA